jgi:ribonuclease P/MRP protein subunit RPP40
MGVMISDDLKAKTQLDNAASTANQVLGRLKKAFRSRGLAVWRTLYVTYIRPHLEFAVQTWSPHLRKDIETLEKIQRRATKTIASIKHLPYTRRLTTLE